MVFDWSKIAGGKVVNRQKKKKTRVNRNAQYAQNLNYYKISYDVYELINNNFEKPFFIITIRVTLKFVFFFLNTNMLRDVHMITYQLYLLYITGVALKNNELLSNQPTVL